MLSAVLILTAIACDGGRSDTASSPSRSPDDPGSPRAQVEVFHYNIGLGKTDGVIDHTIAQVRKERPDVVTLNEICGNQNKPLAEELTALGYVGNYTHAVNTLSCFPQNSQGVAVYVAGDKKAGENSAEDYPDIGQGTACLTAGRDRDIRACVTHLSPGPNDARQELEKLRAKVLDARDEPLVLAGDFNLEPWFSGIEALYQEFYEVDMHAPVCRTPPKKEARKLQETPAGRGGNCTYPADPRPQQTKKKIDYIFVDREHFRADVTARVPSDRSCTTSSLVAAPQPCSDHKELWGVAKLELPSGGNSAPTPTPTWDRRRGFDWEITPKNTEPPPWCAGEKESSTCDEIVWDGSFVAEDGRVSDTGGLFIGGVLICKDTIGGHIRITGEQDVKIDGVIDRPAGDGTLTLRFGKPEIEADEANCQGHKHSAADWERYLRKRIDIAEPVSVTVPGLGGSNETEFFTDVNINGKLYELHIQREVY